MAAEWPQAGAPGPTGPAGTGSIASGVAGVALSGHRAVMPRPDGTVTYASNGTPGDARGPIWVSTAAVALGATGTFTTGGIVVEPSWAWTPGLPVFLGAAGVLTQAVPVAPAFLMELAVAVDATSVFLDPKPPITLI